MSYELLFTYELRVIILIARVLRVHFCVRVTSYYLLDELQVEFIIRVLDYFLLARAGIAMLIV